MKNLSLFVGKIRPQIFLALLILGVVAMYGMRAGLNEVTVGCIAGIITCRSVIFSICDIRSSYSLENNIKTSRNCAAPRYNPCGIRNLC